MSFPLGGESESEAWAIFPKFPRIGNNVSLAWLGMPRKDETGSFNSNLYKDTLILWKG